MGIMCERCNRIITQYYFTIIMIIHIQVRYINLRAKPCFCPGGAAECSHEWSEAELVVSDVHPFFRPGRGGGLLRPSGTLRWFYRLPRVPLRSTRGYSPAPLRGENKLFSRASLRQSQRFQLREAA